MANPKFMSMEQLKNKEEEEKKKKLEAVKSRMLFVNVNENEGPKRRPKTKIRTFLDMKAEEEEREKNEPQIDLEDPRLQEIISTPDSPAIAVLKLLMWLSIAMLSVVMYIKFVCIADCDPKKPFYNLSPFEQLTVNFSGENIIKTVLESFIIMALFIVLTFVLLLLFYYRFDKTLYGILGVSCLMGLILGITIITRDTLFWYNIPFDIITESLFVWNFSVLAMISIFWKSPPILNQAFTAISAVLLSILIIKLLSEWTTWIILVLLVIWDLIAVLCPYGPLKLLTKQVEQRKQEDKDYKVPPGLFFGLLVSIAFISLEAVPNGEENEANKILIFGNPKLGLGDFVFYCVLIGKAATYYEFNLVVGCYVSILFGLIITLIFLLLYRKPLPALPISLILGITVFVVTYFCVNLFSNELNSRLIFI